MNLNNGIKFGFKRILYYLERMDKICNKCMMDPTSHSFKKISEKNGICTFYTNPAKAKLYKDTEGILSHYDHALGHIGEKRWIWIFDGDGFDTDHAMEIRTGQGIATLLTEKYSNNLVEIKVINPSIHIRVILKVIKPFLSDLITSKLKILDDRTYSVLEFV